jgi:hypothetical protein
MAEQVWSINEINARLRELSPLVLTDGLFLYYARVDECIEQELNPRAMPQAMFDQLVSNIEGVKGLESTPLCVQTGRGLEIISGHHRLRAARTAQLEHVLVLVYEGLASDRIFSKQLAHNTISGVDDPQMVKRVWERITDLQARFEAYVDPRSFQKVPERVGFTQVDIDMGALAQTAMLVFLASQMADFDEAVQRLLPKVELDRVYLAPGTVGNAGIRRYDRRRNRRWCGWGWPK